MKIGKVMLSSLAIIGLMCFSACGEKEQDNREFQDGTAPIVGTWQLITGTTIHGVDTIVTDYTAGQELIKIINETHFSFLRHDVNGGKDSSAVFVAGGGSYELKGSKYIEHLDYCNFREWEGNSFELEYTINGDTLITKGLEKVEALNVEHMNIEKYYRIKE